MAELRSLKLQQPDLAEAVDLQIALLELQRRVQGRVPLPWVEVNARWLQEQQKAGVPLLRFEDIPLNWTDFGLMFRETASLLRRFGAVEEEDYRSLQSLARDGSALQPIVREWHRAATERSTAPAGPPQADAVGQVTLLAMRPFLMRCAEAVLPRLDLEHWTQGYCPLCGGEPEFAEITPAAERWLICTRCTGRWRFDPIACPFCLNRDRDRITSFASRDGLYRIAACASCRRYLKAFDGRRAPRGVMVPVDSIATLPLDAAAMQRGYSS
jgi:FdhE protein